MIITVSTTILAAASFVGASARWTLAKTAAIATQAFGVGNAKDCSAHEREGVRGSGQLRERRRGRDLIGEPEDICDRDPDQDGADPRDRQERGRNPGRDRHEDERSADDDPEQVWERSPHATDRAGGDQADRRRTGAAHDRQRNQHQRPDRSPPNHGDAERLTSALPPLYP